MKTRGDRVGVRQGMLFAIESVQIRDPIHEFVVEARSIQQVPIQACFRLPRILLAEFVTHEKQFFAGQ